MPLHIDLKSWADYLLSVSLVKIIPAFVATALFLAMVPGQGMAIILRQCLVGGRRAAFYSVFGNATGLLIWGALSSVGLSAIFAKSPTAFSILKYAGVIFLVGLAVQTLLLLRNEFGKFDYAGGAKTKPLAAYRLGLLTNLTNVKAAVFAVAFIPQFVPKHHSLAWGILLLACVQVCVSVSWYSFLITVVDKASVYLARPAVRRTLTGVSAVGIIVLAIGLFLTSPR